jgi:hypothetical protein
MAVIHSKITAEVIKLPAVRFSEVRSEVSFVLIVIAGLDAEARVDIGGEQFTVQGLQSNEELIYSIWLVINQLIGDGCFVFPFILRKKVDRKSQ